MLWLFAATLLLSAALLFVVEPMFARMALPLLGGTPAVWNTCVVFFQTTLLAAYLYVHATTRLGVRRQACLHLALLVLPLALLPIGIPGRWAPHGGVHPIPWLMAMLVLVVGLPFFVVATTAPLVQRWFAASGHRHARDPYFLYGASNLGSLAGLLAYPLALEPALGLAEQSRFWTVGYALLVVLLIACAAVVWRRPQGVSEQPRRGAGDGEAAERLTTCRRFRWAGLALVPSSLMLGVTTYLSVDIAAVPLLWVVPLSVYLLTFVLAFHPRPIVPQRLLRRLLPILALALIALILRDATQPTWLVIPMHLGVFFVASQVCHGELAADRPAAGHLTEFYLWVALGGVIGGLFNSIAAPLVFTRVVEYPIALVAACALLPPRIPVRRTSLGRDLLAAAAVGALAFGLVRAGRAIDPAQGGIAVALMLGVPAIVCFRFVAQPRRFALGLAMILTASVAGPDRFGTVLHAERSFYGVHRVTTDPTGRFRVLLHGHTIHGRQSLDPARRADPLTYYHRTGPIGQVFAAALPPLRPDSRIAVIGLGSGSLASYGAPGQQWTFYEIDPAVDRIARDPRYFTFLTDTRARWRVVLGDARLSLREAGEGTYSMLVLDAFSSDAIPVHLLTREALDLYLAKLQPDGLLAFHISNNHLRLRPVVAALAADARLVGAAQLDVRVSPTDARGGKTASEWVVVSRARETLSPLVEDPRWTLLTSTTAPVWRDDFSNLLGVFKWR